MRPNAPNGGMQDCTIDLRTAGFMSTGDVSRRLGVNLSMSFIANDLGVAPVAQTGIAYYWAPEQLRKIRRKLIAKLVDDELVDDDFRGDQG